MTRRVAQELSPAKQALLELRLRQRRAPAVPVPRDPGAGPAPLSFAQRRMWLLHRLSDGARAYNIVRALRLRGDLDVDALQRSLSEIVGRHEVLRTSFAAAAVEPVQVASPATAVALNPEDATDAQIGQILAQEASAPFDLQAGLLLRARLLRLSAEHHVLVLATHHIASDETSKGVLFSELGALYRAYRTGLSSGLAPVALQFADYAAWERERLDGPALVASRRWWTEGLARLPTEIGVPTDRPRPPLPAHRGARLQDTVPPATLDALRALAARRQTTLFVIALAAFKTLLHRLSAQEDVVVGAPITGRSLPEVEPLIGPFGNMLVLRCDLSGDPPFEELVGRVRRTVVGAYAQQDVPFEQLVEALGASRDVSRHPLFQVAFNFLQTPGAEAPALDGLDVEPIPFDPGVAKFDIALVASVRPEGLRLLWEYSTELFDRESLERISARLLRLLEAIARDPRVRISELPLLSAGEVAELERHAAGPSAPVTDTCLHALIAARARERPAAIAVTCGEQRLTHAELDERANRLARELQALGVGPGSLVGVFLDRSVDLLAALLGILKAGGAYVPLDPAFPQGRIEFMIEDAGLGVLLTQRDLRARLPDVAAHMLAIDEAALDRHSPQAPACAATPGDLAYVIYTSGSTGRPKGVAVEHRNIVNLLESMCREPGITAEDVLLAITTLSFDIAALELFAPLLAGGRVELVPDATSGDPAELERLLRRSGATVMQATPATWRMLLDHGWAGDRDLKVLCGGEALAPGLAAELATRCGDVYNLYGPTETTVWSTLWRVQTPTPAATAPIGRPISNTTCRVLDTHDRPVPVGVPGELVIEGAGVARGYLDRPELTAERFAQDPASPGERAYRTGDVARRRADGLLEFLGRRDHQVKIRGHRIEPAEIEVVLSGHPDIRQAVVHAIEVAGEQLLAAYLIPAREIAASELRRHLLEHLPRYMLPSAVVFLDELPLTPNGKVDRNALPAPELAPQEPVAARTPVETQLVAIWAGVLSVGEVGIHDDFFGLGGHSLLVTRLMARIRDEIGAELPMRQLYEAPTIAQLAENVTAELLGDDGELDELLAEIEGVHDDAVPQTP